MPKVLNWINDNSTFVNILFTILCGIVGWLLYRRTYYREKRSAALFGFFVRFDMILEVLQTQINKCSEENSNPFALLYTARSRGLNCLSLPGGTPDETFKLFSPIAKELKSLLLETENNVFPKSCKKEEWYKSQITILQFALMITDRLNFEANNSDDIETEANNRLTELKKAVTTLRDILNQVKY